LLFLSSQAQPLAVLGLSTDGGKAVCSVSGILQKWCIFQPDPPRLSSGLHGFKELAALPFQNYRF
jgi:hypothetical protein